VFIGKIGAGIVAYPVIVVGSIVVNRRCRGVKSLYSLPIPVVGGFKTADIATYRYFIRLGSKIIDSGSETGIDTLGFLNSGLVEAGLIGKVVGRIDNIPLVAAFVVVESCKEAELVVFKIQQQIGGVASQMVGRRL